METISLKLDENILHNVDERFRRHNFSTRTEFIRAAIRDKLEDLSRQDLIEEFLLFKGKSRKKTTDKEFEKIRERAFEELAKERGWS